MQSNHKTIIISGAGGVLGKAFIKRLLDDGHSIFASEINSQKVDELKKIFSKNLNFYASTCDISDEESITDWFAEIQKINEIDVVINNASITSEYLRKHNQLPKDFETTTLASWQMTIDVSLTGAFLIAREFGKTLGNTKFDSPKKLINLSSMYALNGPDHQIYKGTSINSFAAYSSAKAGLIGLTKWLSTYWGNKNVTVNAIAPGGVFNNHEKKFKDRLENKIPLQKMADPTDIANALSFLVSDDSNYMTGQVLNVDGGYTAL